ncbi:MAG: thiamine-phosphate kinase [Candidatus Methanofastidiosum sp.]|nr:thiamine-phosphate kinase [Methanofastidiosum sp.]
MNIREIGGEFELIKRISRDVNDENVIKGIGDDCAVIKYKNNSYLLITTDMMVENDHFSLKWHTPIQIGNKLMEVNVSDIVAMGGTPKYAFVSMSIKKDTQVEFIDEFYNGLCESTKKHGVHILGGDTTHGTEYVFNITLLGEVEAGLLRLRSGAKLGDLICVTGNLGGNAAGLNLLQFGKEGFFDNYLKVKSRSAVEAKIIAKYATSMIDVSDGLASEIKHICEESKVGAEILYDRIPLSNETIASGNILGMDPHDFALYGGEDFELVFTISKGNIDNLRANFNDFTIVGKIVKGDVALLKNNQKIELKKGYDHFE